MHASYQKSLPGHIAGEADDVNLQHVAVGGLTPLELRVKNDGGYERLRRRILRSVPPLVIALFLILMIAAFSKSTDGGKRVSNRSNNKHEKIELLEETVSLDSLLAMGGENDWILYANRSTTVNRSATVVN